MSRPASLSDARAAPWLAHLDARVKIFWLLGLSFVSVTVDTLPSLMTLGVLGAAPIVAIRMPWRAWLAVVVIVLSGVWGAVLSQAMFYADTPRTPLLTMFGLSLWREGALYGLAQSLRFTGGTLSGLAVCLSTSPEQLLTALTRLRVPVTIGFLVTTALRFLPTMFDEWLVIRQALRLRGYRFRVWGPRGYRLRGWRIELSMFVPLLAAALRRAAALAISVTMRGFDPSGAARKRVGQAQRGLHPEHASTP